MILSRFLGKLFGNQPRLYILCVGAFIFLYMAAVDYFVPMWSDEFAYSFVLNTDIRINGPAEILLSAQRIYLTWSGRSLIFIIHQTLIWLGEHWFDVSNALVFTTFIFLLPPTVIRRKWNSYKDLYLLLLVTGTAWFSLPIPGETIFWQTGSINYLWPATIMLVFLLPYRRIFDLAYPKTSSWRKLAGMALLGIITGSTQETAAATVIIYLVLVLGWRMVVEFRQAKSVFLPPTWAISGLAGVLIGAAIVFLAPGNQRRLEIMYGDMPLLQRLANFPSSLSAIIKHEAFLFIILAIAAMAAGLVFLLRKKIGPPTPGMFTKALIFFTAGTGSLLVMAVSPEFSYRAAFSGSVMFFCAFLALVEIILPAASSRPILTTAGNLILTAVCTAAIISGAGVFNDYRAIHQKVFQRQHIMDDELSRGNRDIRLPELGVTPSRFVFIYDIGIYRFGNTNQQFAHYYNLNSVVLDKPSIIIDFNEPPPYDLYQLVYDTGNGYRWNEPVSVSIVNNIESGRSVPFALPDLKIKNVRFDPGLQPGRTFKIKAVELNLGGISTTLSGQNLFERLVIATDMKNLRLENGLVVFETTGTDPGIELQAVDMLR